MSLNSRSISIAQRPGWRATARFAACLVAMILVITEAAALDPAPLGPHLERVGIELLMQNKGAADCRKAAPKTWRCSTALRLGGVSNAYVDGEGSRIVFEDASPGKGGISLTGFRNVTLANFEIGWADPPDGGRPPIQSLGRVVPCRAGNGGVLSLDARYSGVSPLGAVSAWDDTTGWTWSRTAPNHPDVYFPSDTTVSFQQGQSSCIGELAGQVGRRVLARLMLGTNQAFRCQDCENVTVERIRITYAPGMGFVFSGTSRNIVIRGNTIEPSCGASCERPQPSITMDGIHVAGAPGPILIEGNDFGWQGDDSVNVTGLLVAGRIEEPSGAKGAGRIRVQLAERSRGRMGLFRAGSPATLYDMGLNVLGRGKVATVNVAAMSLELESDPGVRGEVVLTADDRVPTDVVIRNNHFHDHRARGILMGARHGLIENNLIERVTMQGILLAADTGRWMEGPGASEVRVARNTLTKLNRYAPDNDYPSAISAAVKPNAGYTGKAGGAIRGLVIEGSNSFSDIISNPGRTVSLGQGVVDSRSEDR